MTERISKRHQRRIAQTKAKAASVADSVLRAVAYTRVSTQEQADGGFGLDIQEGAIRAFAQSQGYELVDVVADRGVSGATKPADRPGFARVLSLAKPGMFVLFWKIDRLARDMGYAVATLNALMAKEVYVRSVTEPIDLSSIMGRGIFAMLATLGEQERSAITERTLGGRKAKAARGGFAGGAIPIGYRTTDKGKIGIDDEGAVAVRRIHELRAAGQTLKGIASALNADGIATRRGGRWHPSTVAYVLDNPAYRGQIAYLFETGMVKAASQHEAIILEDATP